jgi:hypothetical protein
VGILTADMKRVVEEQRLGFWASVCADGTPDVSPTGTTAVWDDDHLTFANIRSAGTVANLRQHPTVEVDVVDPFVRKGYRFKGVATILESGPRYDEAIRFYAARGSKIELIREIVLLRVEGAQPIDSPAYDIGMTEREVRARWERHYDALRSGPPASLREALIAQMALSAEGPAWHGPSIREALDGVTAPEALRHPIAGAHSIWELVLHMSAGYRLVLRRLEGDDSPLMPGQDWPAVPVPATEEAWQRDVETLLALNRRMREALATFPMERLYAPVVAEPPYTAFVQFVGLTQEAAYHTGQIVLLRRAG